jgi:hypothetical protein
MAATVTGPEILTLFWISFVMALATSFVGAAFITFTAFVPTDFLIMATIPGTMF